MKRTLNTIALFLFLAVQSFGATNITTPTVSGHWTLAGSPYLVFNNVKVDVCSALIIDPGVEVIFQGYYSFDIYGSLAAAGTSSQRISFHVNDTTGWYARLAPAGGWKGITWYAYSCASSDASHIDYCDFSDIKSQSVFDGFRENKLEHCRFYHNIGSFTFATGPLASFEINYCSIHDCNSWIDSVFYNDKNLIKLGAYVDASIKITHCDIYNNYGTMPFIQVQDATFIFKQNNIYGNVVTDSLMAEGTIYMQNCSSTISDNKFYNNVDAEAAPIHSFNSRTLIERNYICNNKSINGMATGYMCGALQGGGGIRISCTGDSTQIKSIIRDNIIANNYSGFGGGGIYIINASVEITNNQILNNSGVRGGGIAFNNYPSTKHNLAVIKNNIFFNNVSPLWMTTSSGLTNVGNDTNDIFTAYADTVIFENNWLQNNVTKSLDLNNFFTDTFFVLKGDTTTNIIGANPGLIAPTLTADETESALTADFRLLASSSCINKGSSIGIEAGPADYVANNRVFNGIIDIGAYEYGAAPFLEVPPIAPLTNKIVLYPNPATSTLFISTPEAKGTLQLQDISGRQVAKQNVANTLTSFDIESLPRGMYFAIWNNENNGKIIEKVIVQ